MNRSTEILTINNQGREFLIEASAQGGLEDISGFENFKSEELMESIKGISETFVEALKSVSPDKFAVEFGVEISLKSGKLLALLCNGEGKANLKITLEWSKKE
ncbi:CU044_2847 family protein [Pedobacter aquatilis]|uniref:CU044_2847 family protein n=1 Tax=Pedobacter aquatilis TaxID=351343 RepID=UPI00292F1E3E|nr:CU044_2847 family protein [Pedobacter aquatilis]